MLCLFGVTDRDIRVVTRAVIAWLVFVIGCAFYVTLT